MATVTLATARADLACDNCSTTQTHDLELLYDDDAGKLVLKKTCRCADDGEPYVEEREIELEES